MEYYNEYYRKNSKSNFYQIHLSKDNLFVPEKELVKQVDMIMK